MSKQISCVLGVGGDVVDPVRVEFELGRNEV